MRRRDGPEDGQAGAVERWVRRAVDVAGLEAHATELGIVDHAADVDQQVETVASRSPGEWWNLLVAGGGFAVVFGVAIERLLTAFASEWGGTRLTVGSFSMHPMIVPWVLLPPACAVVVLARLRSVPLRAPLSPRPLLDGLVAGSVVAGFLLIGFEVEPGAHVVTSVLPFVPGRYALDVLGFWWTSGLTAGWFAIRGTPEGSDVTAVDAAGLALLTMTVMVYAHVVLFGF